MLKHIRFLLILALVLSLLSAVQVARAAIVVHPGNLQGWVIGTFIPPISPPTFSGFVNGPGAPPLGTGSYQATIGSSAQKIQLVRFGYEGIPLSSLNVSYATHRLGTNANDWYLNVYISTTGGAIANCRIDFAPTAGGVGSWITHNATGASNSWYASPVNPGGPYASGCPGQSSVVVNGSFAAMLSSLPAATTLAPLFAGGAALVFNMGDSGASYLNYDGAIDAVTINGTTWDFELTAPAAPPGAIEFFNPGDCRVDPRPGDRLAICCEANRIVVYGVANNSRGFLLNTFNFEDLAKAGARGIFVDKRQDGVISASMSRSEHMWVAWSGGQYNATGSSDQGFAKLVRCPLPASIVELLKQRGE